MNKQELIKEVKEIGIYGLNLFSTVVEGIPTKTAIELIKQLDVAMEARNLQNGIKRNPTETSSLVHGLTATRLRKRRGTM